MELVPNHNSDRACMWSTFADFSEEEPREELLAIRFLNAESKKQQCGYIINNHFRELILFSWEKLSVYLCQF